ncbi:hypothetical protein LMH87_001965 [Akanthomyces muscarius]|uniref:SET domain-containing protein n=1 Tax=Akanthomyces muscarius TaxID=2231603 RepID=A0A9W8Q5X4_AKAMU|nr:hypothetical protein LMH87_001965 [Akanthomyces muscarius]KAJ4147448.1 hypothetical protein LMH87_001965 [Akanthomyces muscarius]
METEIENLLAWAETKGIEINGCSPKQLHGRGVGIVATRALKAGEVILRVPTDTLRSLANTPPSIIASLPGASVHAILACSLCLDTTSSLSAWRAVFPSKADIHAVLPICWPSELRALLPHTAATLLGKQSAKFQKDWATVEAVYAPQLSKEDFLYGWLLVNTRSFYHTTRQTAKLPKEDHMVLQPVADLFNHSPAGWCAGAFTASAFTITTQEPHAAGQELFIKYGSHGNDFLLVEYGFTLPPPLNAWDETCLDPHVCHALTAAGQRPVLEDAGFWGGYMLDRETACYRTHVALRTLCLTPLQWRAVLDGERDEDRDQRRVDAELVRVLRRYEEDIVERIRDVEEATAGDELSREGLRDRWVQIQELVVGTRRRLEEQ